MKTLEELKELNEDLGVACSVLVIHLECPTATCCICGQHDVSRWSVPISADTALIVANDYAGDWGAKPACRVCWQKHDEGQFVGHDPAF